MSKLVVEIQSFSFRNSYPFDESGNGGGYVFDCRGILNPHRFESLKYLTGKDSEIHDFFTSKTKMPEFLNNIFMIINISINNYIERDFEHLQINFGCTGGQHRSVYAAEKAKEYLSREYPNISIIIKHLNEKNWLIK